MKLASWNVNRIQPRLPQLLAWLEASRPDAVALQELRCTEAGFPRAEIKAAGYGALVVGERRWNGVALLARDAEPVPTRRALPGDAADRQARYVEAAIHGIVMASIYLPNGNPCPGPKFDYKLAWFERLRAHAAELWRSGLPVVLAGDYNVVPTDADIYAPATWLDNALLQPEPRRAWAELVAQGWTDALQAASPGRPPFTFWDYRRRRWERDAGLRIDHLLLSAAPARRLAAAGVEREWRGLPQPSDHAPVWVELR